MKAASFDYIRAKSIDEVCLALNQGDGEAQIIAGGQTLIPLMAMRMSRPQTLVDINDIEELRGIEIAEKVARIKAGTRQADVLGSIEIRENLPILSEALAHVGHTQTRNRGTIGGSLVAADPSAEICLIAQLLNAKMTAKSTNGTRSIPASQFFDSAMVTSLNVGECLTEVEFPIWENEHSGFGFHETSIRDSDYALAAAAAQITIDSGGKCERIHLAVGGATPCPMRLNKVETALTGKVLDDGEIDTAISLIPALLEPQSDVHASAEYRRRVSTILAARAIRDARDRAQGEFA
mgnify:FL=1